MLRSAMMLIRAGAKLRTQKLFNGIQFSNFNTKSKMYRVESPDLYFVHPALFILPHH